ncbi:MAG: RNA-guided endonuclease TnpB family protein, partial [Nitrososphaerales archaeon]
MVGYMRKCLVLNVLEPTKAKKRLLRESYQTFFCIVREALRASNGVRSRTELHESTYRAFMNGQCVASQLVIEATSYAWSNRRIIKGKPNKCVVRFDKRLFSFKRTKRGNPVLSLRLSHIRTGLPISQDGAYQKVQEHLKQGWKLTSILMKRNLSFIAILSKAMPEPIIRPNWMGIDINSSKIAVSVIGGGKVLKQTYFGHCVSTRQFRFEERRATLQGYRDTVSRGKAGLKLKKLSGKQKNYVKTRMWQITNEIVKLAKEFNANIAIEKLRGVRKRKREWSKKSTRKTNRIPYGFFRHALMHVAEREGVIVEEIRPHYTSQTCPQCGCVSKANWKGYSYFRCVKCGYEANRDRVASLNIAHRATHVADPEGQFPMGSASVSRRVLKD